MILPCCSQLKMKERKEPQHKAINTNAYTKYSYTAYTMDKIGKWEGDQGVV